MFTQLYRRYASKVYAKCITLLQDDNTAKDAVQDIFIKILLNLSKFNEESSFSTWVYSITYNYCIDVIRKRKKIPIFLAEDPARIKDEADVELPDSVLLEMKNDQLQKVMNAMPIGDKSILLMKYQDGMQIKDIAIALDKSESAIKMQIMRAKQKAQNLHDEQLLIEN